MYVVQRISIPLGQQQQCDQMEMIISQNWRWYIRIERR